MRVGILLAVLLLLLSGCSLRRKPQAKTPQVPAPAPAKSVRQEPLSVPQTAVTLPPSEPIDPEALKTQTLPPPPEIAPGTERPTRAPRRVPGPQPPPPAKAEAPLPQPPPEERPRLQEIVPPQEQRRIAESIAVRKREIAAILEMAATRTLDEHDQSVAVRVRSFLQLSDRAAAGGEWRQAEALSARALVLARELRGAR